MGDFGVTLPNFSVNTIKKLNKGNSDRFYKKIFDKFQETQQFLILGGDHLKEFQQKRL
jgi:hypothetical protein